MLQETALRVPQGDLFAAPIIVSNEAHRFIIGAQLQDVGVKALAHLLEPAGRNTAPAVAVAAGYAQRHAGDAILLILPADHHIQNVAAFRAAAAAGMALAKAGRLVTFGIVPTGPETGYGYIHRGAPLDVAVGSAFAVERFVEKPDSATAARYLAEGGYDWNSGIFMFRADRILSELRAHAPDIAEKAAEALDRAVQDLDFLRLDAAAFEACPADSIDYAVMELTREAAVIPVEMGWSDVGSWSALWDIGAKDAAGNVVSGDVLIEGAGNNLIRAERGLVAAIGVKNLVIVETGDVVLVAARDQVQKVKSVVERLAAAGRREHQAHNRVYRPWGFYESLDQGPRYQVKHLMVKPGAALSLQLHRQRAEHWVVVQGQARVTVGETVQVLTENQSIYIPVNTKHRLENAGDAPLSLIEVQSGSYLGEDDIVRFDDVYGR